MARSHACGLWTVSLFVGLTYAPLAAPSPSVTEPASPSRTSVATTTPVVVNSPTSPRSPSVRPRMEWADYDQDGFEDAFVIHPDGQARLLRNDGRGFVDVTELVGLDARPQARTASWMDVDSDGWVDLLYASAGGELALFRNSGGAFRNETELAGLGQVQEVLALHWHDADEDGRVDLHVVSANGHLMLRNAWESERGFLPVALPGSVAGSLDSAAPAEERTEQRVDAGALSGGRTPQAAGPLQQADASRTTVTTGDDSGQRHEQALVVPNTQGAQYVGDSLINLLECLETMRDQSDAMNCLMASSDPVLGMLYPLSSDFFVSDAGNVGIGTTSPTQTLDVAGNIKFSGDLILDAGPPSLGPTSGARIVFPDNTVQDTAFPPDLLTRMSDNEDDDDDQELLIASLDTSIFGPGGLNDRVLDIEVISTNFNYDAINLDLEALTNIDFLQGLALYNGPSSVDLGVSGGSLLVSDSFGRAGISVSDLLLDDGFYSARFEMTPPIGGFASNAVLFDVGEFQLREGALTRCFGLGSVNLNGTLQESFDFPGIISTFAGTGQPTACAGYAEVTGFGSEHYGLVGSVESSSAPTRAGVYGLAGSVAGAYGVFSQGRMRAQDSLASTTGGVFLSQYTGAVNSDTRAVRGISEPAPNWGIGVHGEGGWQGLRGESTLAGSGSRYGVYGLASNGSTNYGVYGFATSGTAYGGYFVGNVLVQGTLSKAGGSFQIDHPQDPENKYLYHSFVESPDMMNVYNGNVTLDMNGEAWVELPEYFEALNRDFRYQLTPIGAPGPNLYVAVEISANRFQIAGGEPEGRVSWQVTGVRQDKWAEANRIPTVVDKKPEDRGTFLYPEAHGKPAELGTEYQRLKREKPDHDVTESTGPELVPTLGQR